MTLDLFFEKFDQLADAPNAVARMRELVLELAVQGKLVPQDARDEPADKALERAVQCYAKGNKHKATGAWAERHESLERLPPGWTWTCNSVLGNPNPRVTAADDAIVGFVPMNIIPTDFRGMVQPETRRWRDIKTGYTHFADGDIAVAKITPCFQNGKACVFERLPGGVGAGTTELHVVRPYPALVEPRYLLLFFKSPGFVRGGVETFSGTAGQQRVAVDYFRYCPIPLPPLAEQKRIVAKVDELMALCDRLEAQQREREERQAGLARASLTRFAEAPKVENLELLFHRSYEIAPAELRKTILTLAVRGKLVPQDRTDQPAQCLLEQIAAHKRVLLQAKTIRQGKVSRPPGMQRQAASLPAGWQWTNVDSLCFKVTDGTHFTPQYASTGVRFVSAKDLVNGRLTFANCKHITVEEHDQLFRRCNPEYHDVVISKSGSIGSVALVEDRGEFSLFESLALLKFDKTALDAHYLVLAMRHACASLTEGHIKGVAVKHLHLDLLRGIELALPPLAEQRRIIARVDQLIALVDQLEAQLTASRAAATRLLDAILAELTAAEYGTSPEAASAGMHGTTDRPLPRRVATRGEEVAHGVAGL